VGVGDRDLTPHRIDITYWEQPFPALWLPHLSAFDWERASGSERLLGGARQVFEALEENTRLRLAPIEAEERARVESLEAAAVDRKIECQAAGGRIAGGAQTD
jgi:hypothetical protein